MSLSYIWIVLKKWKLKRKIIELSLDSDFRMNSLPLNMNGMKKNNHKWQLPRNSTCFPSINISQLTAFAFSLDDLHNFNHVGGIHEILNLMQYLLSTCNGVSDSSTYEVLRMPYGSIRVGFWFRRVLFSFFLLLSFCFLISILNMWYPPFMVELLWRLLNHAQNTVTRTSGFLRNSS